MSHLIGLAQLPGECSRGHYCRRDHVCRELRGSRVHEGDQGARRFSGAGFRMAVSTVSPLVKSKLRSLSSQGQPEYYADRAAHFKHSRVLFFRMHHRAAFADEYIVSKFATLNRSFTKFVLDILAIAERVSLAAV